MSTDFVLVVNAERAYAFDALEFSSKCSLVLPPVYVLVDLAGSGGTDVLDLFGTGSGPRPKTTLLHADDMAHPDAGNRIASELGLPTGTPIARPASIAELSAALNDPTVSLVWVATYWAPAVPGLRKVTSKQFHPDTSGFFDGNGVYKPNPSPNPYTTPQCAYGAFEVRTTTEVRIGNFLVIPTTYAPPLEGGLQVGTDNLWLTAALPDAFVLRPVQSLSSLGTVPARRSYDAASFSFQSLATEPTASSNVWRIDFVWSGGDPVGSGNPVGYLRAEAPPTGWRWYGSPSAMSNGLFDFPAGRVMKLTRVTTGLTAELLTGMRLAVTPYK